MAAKFPVYRPKARPELLFSELAEETLVYDFATHGAHCMTPLAAAVLRRCDGEHTAAQLVDAIASATKDEVDAALVALARAGLLLPPAPTAVDRARRRVIGQLARTAALGVAAPLVWSIVAPSVAEAASRITCIPPAGCMGGGTGCCGTSGGAAMACAGNGTCSGVSLACTGQTCR